MVQGQGPVNLICNMSTRCELQPFPLNYTKSQVFKPVMMHLVATTQAIALAVSPAPLLSGGRVLIVAAVPVSVAGASM